MVSTGGGAVLNPEASVFQLPTTTTHASPPPPAINGFHSDVYPFMNGDVTKQCCGVSPPTPDAAAAVGVECPSAEQAAASTTPPAEPVTEAGTLKAPAQTTSTSQDQAAAHNMAAASAQNSDQEGDSKVYTPVSSSQQNGEVSPESSQPSASPLHTPLPTPPPPANVAADGATSKDEDELAVTVEEEEAAKEEVKEAKESLTTSETQGTQTTPAQTPTTNTPAVTPPAQQPPSQQPPQPLTRDQIKQLVAQQVEYFFSRENLSNDPYLISQMDSDQYVPVYILANCSQFKNITKDHSIIVEALKVSPFVQLDEENNRVRPNYKRCIVILREIAESTPVDEIEAIFKGEECPKLVSCEFVHNSSWYVTFESDEDAQKAYQYLRGVVKTFKDKPILARIKTKPMSRLGFTVLPSYGNKGGSEGKDGSGPPSTPSAGMASGPGTPAPTSNYNPAAAGQRFMYSAPSTVNANNYSYSYSTPAAPMPTAYFYPNMMQWTAPAGGFYDINSFFQLNGLSPQATFKPQMNHNIRYPGGRRGSKHRDGRFDKNDSRHSNMNGPGGNMNNNHNQHYHPGPRPHPGHHRPQAAQSPSQAVHRVSSQPPPPAVPSPPSPSPPQPPAASAAGGNHDSFAHSDFSIASQTNLYTSFSPPVGPAPSVISTDKKEVVTVPKTSSAGSSGLPASSTQQLTTAAPTTTTTTTTASPSSAAMLNNVSPEAASPASTGCPVSSAATTLTSTTHPPPVHQHMHPPPPPPQHHRHHQYQHMQPSLSGGHPHRNNYGAEHFHHHHPPHMNNRDPQQSRPIPRGLKRRPRGREEEGGSSTNSRGGLPQRSGGFSQAPALDKSNGNAETSQPAVQPPPPQFDLEATAFPPLPGSDEQTPVTEEKKRPPELVASAWGGSDTQRFSDVMKGTAKPRTASQSCQGDKEVEPSTPTTPTTSSSSPSPAVTASPTVAAVQPVPAAPQPSHAPSTHAVSSSSASQETSTAAPTTASSASTSFTTSSLPSGAVVSSGASSAAPSTKPEARPAPREMRAARDDRRAGGVGGGPRERREFTRDHPRDYQRDTRSLGSRDRDHRIARDGRTGKENRPLPQRSWKEDKMDADGWITKGPKESRSQRESRDQWERAEAAREFRQHHLVNGDSTPPQSPKPQKKVEVKANVEESGAEEGKVAASQSLNNNEGEHKTSWAKMALASKDQMERLAAELKEKEEQEKIKKQRLSTRMQPKPQEKVLVPRERDGKPSMRRDGPPRENRLSSERSTVFRPRDSARPKSPK